VKRVALVAGVVVGLYLTGRAVAEFWLIHWGDPASYRNDWGGPSLLGVLAVHCLPGLLLPGYLTWRISRRSAASGVPAS
jgi:O-antigen ligase